MIAEKKLIIECTRLLDPDACSIEQLIYQAKDFPYIVGQLAMNRVAGVAYYVLNETGMFHKTNFEFRSTLRSLYQANCIKSKAAHASLMKISEYFQHADFPYAFVKGAYLSTEIYPTGLRTVNDFDVLVAPAHVPACEKLLQRNGFFKGKYGADNEFLPMPEQSIYSRLQKTETGSFGKIFNRTGQEVIEVEINSALALNTQRSDAVIALMLENTIPFSVEKRKQLYTLASIDFLIHICTQVYQEATSYSWVSMGRDLSLYKFLDIYMLLHKFHISLLFELLRVRILELNLQKECYYAIYHTLKLYPSLYTLGGIDRFLTAIMPVSTDYLNRVYHPEEHKEFKYRNHFSNRFLAVDRISSLTEVESEHT